MPAARRLPRGRLYFNRAVASRAVVRGLWVGAGSGPLVGRLEADFAARMGCRHAIALPHCRTALWLALRHLGVPAGSRVAMTPVTVPPIVQAVRLAGMLPLYADLAPHSGQLDLVDLEKRLTADTRVLLVTHLCGMSADMRQVRAFADRHGLVLVEDASQAMGARFDGCRLGAWGRVGVFSISTMKPVSSFHGGLLVTDDDDLAAAIRADTRGFSDLPRRDLLAWLGRDLVMDGATRQGWFDHIAWPLLRLGEAAAPRIVDEFQRGNVIGLPKDRRYPVLDAPPPMWTRQYSEAQAAMALDALQDLEAGNARRRDLGLHLLACLRTLGVGGLPLVQPGVEPVFWRFPLWTARPDALRAHLRQSGIDSGKTNLACCSRLTSLGQSVSLPHAEAFVDQTVFLPMHPDLTESDVDRVAQAVAAFARISPREARP